MQCTTESNVQLHSYKAKQSYNDCTDSGYSGLFQSPQSITGVDPSRSSSPAEFSETPKENLKLPPSPKSGRLFCTDSRDVLPSSTISWCETPKVHRRDASLRHRLFSKPTAVSGTQSPSTTKTEFTFSTRSERWISASFDSLDLMTVGGSNTFKLNQELALPVRKLHLFPQVRASTLEDGKVNLTKLPSFEGSVSLSEAEVSDSISASDRLDTSAPGFDKLLPFGPLESSDTNIQCDSDFCTQTPTYSRCVWGSLFSSFSVNFTF